MEAIISKDYRKFIEDNDIYLSDWDKATLIYNRHDISCSEKVQTLCEIKDSTDDEQLRGQIEERLERDSRYLEMFHKADPNAYYELSIWYKDDFDEEGIFRDFKSAFEAGMEEGERFKIKKEYFVETKEAEKAGSIEGAVSFYQDGKVEKILWLYKKGHAGIDNSHFADRCVDLPLCFKMGDMVHIVGTECYGIVTGVMDEQKHYQQVIKFGDFSDFQVCVDLLYRGDKYLSVFSHEHVHPTELEYARFESGDSRKGFMEYMQHTFLFSKGKWMNGQGRSAKRMDEVLRKIKIVWKQYPELRLGQLLINVVGKKDLFGVEDEVLLERLQKNIFPLD